MSCLKQISRRNDPSRQPHYKSIFAAVACSFALLTTSSLASANFTHKKLEHSDDYCVQSVAGKLCVVNIGGGRDGDLHSAHLTLDGKQAGSIAKDEYYQSFNFTDELSNGEKTYYVLTKEYYGGASAHESSPLVIEVKKQSNDVIISNAVEPLRHANATVDFSYTDKPALSLSSERGREPRTYSYQNGKLTLIKDNNADIEKSAPKFIINGPSKELTGKIIRRQEKHPFNNTIENNYYLVLPKKHLFLEKSDQSNYYSCDQMLDEINIWPADSPSENSFQRKQLNEHLDQTKTFNVEVGCPNVGVYASIMSVK